MKTLGIIGGMSWESTSLYYAALNRGVTRRLGQAHSAKLVLASLDFQDIIDLQLAGSWDDAGELLAGTARRLVAGGAEAIALAVNTMHKVAPQIEAAVDVPFIDIRDAVAAVIGARKAKRVALLGTHYVVEEPFYGDYLEKAGACKILRPDGEDNRFVHRIIYGELSRGIVSEATRVRVLGILGKLRDVGAEAAVLGCTELPMLQLAEQSPIPLIDSTAVHVEACLDFATAR
jgi:aspartate racemase